jgi:hypothetical protein
VRTLIRKDFLDALAVSDALLLPITPTAAFKIAEKTEDPLSMYLSDIFSIPASLAGVPALSFPTSFDASGLPIGLQLVGRPFDEETILRVARARAEHAAGSRVPWPPRYAGRRWRNRDGVGGVRAIRAGHRARSSAQLKTKTKIFCACATTFGAAPNSQVCPVCLGLPGVLPVLNERAVTFAVMTGLAVGATIHPRSIFARKNYFYPDLPKGYQISQYDRPLCEGGGVEIHAEDVRKHIGLVRIHLEEDAGKSLHPEGKEGVNTTRVDLNRAGVPLIEIVSEPDLRSGVEAYHYLTKLKQILVYLDVCDGNMEEGSLRCDANVSVRPRGRKEFGTRTEIKNLNSFRYVEKAIAYEIDRQIALIESGGRVVQETLLWDSARGVAETLRGKEEAHDYRYFPEPDLLPVDLEASWVED